ncbi:MAG: type II secretion system F family protein [Phycisphaerae bacterium]|nr:type II secretion system F family protein [Phycisphaerae bacterium]
MTESFLPMGSLLAQFGSLESLALYVLPLAGSILLVFGIAQVVADLRRTESRRVETRLRERCGAQAAHNEAAARESLLRQLDVPTTGLTGLIGRLKFIPNLQRAIEQANLPWVASTLLLNLIGLACLAYLACTLSNLAVWWGVGAAFAMIVLPLLYIHIRRKLRLNRFLHQLPDVFELMSQGLRAGHSLGNAIHLVSQQMHDPAGTEFARVFHEQNLGLKIEDALQNMANRIQIMDVRFFVTAVLIQRSSGGDLAEVLDNISGVIRDRIKLFGTVKALTAEGRLSGYVLFVLPFAVFAVEQVINPEYGRILLEEPIGHYMLITAFVMQLMGLAMIKKIVNIRV